MNLLQATLAAHTFDGVVKGSSLVGYAVEFRYNYIPTDYHWLDLINDLIYMLRGLEDYTARYYPNIAGLGVWQ